MELIHKLSLKNAKWYFSPARFQAKFQAKQMLHSGWTRFYKCKTDRQIFNSYVCLFIYLFDLILLLPNSKQTLAISQYRKQNKIILEMDRQDGIQVFSTKNK